MDSFTILDKLQHANMDAFLATERAKKALGMETELDWMKRVIVPAIEGNAEFARGVNDLLSLDGIFDDIEGYAK